MTAELRTEITRISKEFFYGSLPEKTFGRIDGTGILVVDPLSGYLNMLGYRHEISQIPPMGNRPIVLILAFPGGWQFIPAGKDLSFYVPNYDNWMWVSPSGEIMKGGCD